jgi:predicted chitinase
VGYGNGPTTAGFFKGHKRAHGLNELADARGGDNDDQDFVTISIRINGGWAGLAERKRYWAKAKSVLGVV